jgi:dymeclin
VPALLAPSVMPNMRGLLQDVYMQTNTLAALTNLAPHMSGLTSHAAQRLVSLFDMVARKHSKLAQFDSSTVSAPNDDVNGAAYGPAGCSLHVDSPADGRTA